MIIYLPMHSTSACAYSWFFLLLLLSVFASFSSLVIIPASNNLLFRKSSRCAAVHGFSGPYPPVSESRDRAIRMKAQVPSHIAFILDGNGRWAQQRGLPRLVGHSAGAMAAKKIVLECRELGISCITMYALSTENWKRPPIEVSGLLQLMEDTIREDAEEFRDNGIVLRVIGQIHRLPQSFQDLIKEIANKEKELQIDEDSCMTLCLAVSYGGRDDIVNAARQLVEQVQSGALPGGPSAITEEALARATGPGALGLPDPAVLVRTGGHRRLSNFLLWQAAYAELHFSPKLWPDFNEKDLHDIIRTYSETERKFGGVGEQAVPAQSAHFIVENNGCPSSRT